MHMNNIVATECLPSSKLGIILFDNFRLSVHVWICLGTWINRCTISHDVCLQRACWKHQCNLVCVCRYVCLALAKMSASKGGLNILITEVALYRVWMCLFVNAPLARVTVLVHSGCCALKLLGPKHLPLQRQSIMYIQWSNHCTESVSLATYLSPAGCLCFAVSPGVRALTNLC